MLPFIIGLLLILIPSKQSSQDIAKSIVKNDMEVSWHYLGDRIHFTMSAPTAGWVTIGFNTSTSMTGAYLLMGRVRANKAEVLEHYTISPGNYKSFPELKTPSFIADVQGEQDSEKTTLKFSVPIKALNKYQKDLSKGLSYHLILAYSQEDDFQHHSIMRSSINITL